MGLDSEHSGAGHRTRKLLLACGTIAIVGGCMEREVARPVVATQAMQQKDLASVCNAAAVQEIASSLPGKVTISKIANQPGPFFEGGTKYQPASGEMPAYCQVTGSYVSNPGTGKTSNFLATFPEKWNGKYLQFGCASHCGSFMVSDPATPLITISSQGTPGQIIQKGYAAFATDEGHVETSVWTSGAWAIKGPGQVDEEAITDLFWRSAKSLTQIGKAFTRAFYAHETGAPATISRSYFSGCSGGGRDAMVAASYYPEEFDGIIAGSPYNLVGRSFHAAATSLAAYRSPGAALSPELHSLFDRTVKAQCDALDGVKDGLIQNPAACNFLPERDLPKCEGEKTGGQCFTKAQIDTVRVVMSAITDEHGNILQPGYSVSELIEGYAPASPPDRTTPDLWPDNRASNPWSLANATIKVFGHKNDPTFRTESVISFREGGPGPAGGFHAVVPRAEFDRVIEAGRAGIGHFPENADKLIRQGRKLMIWHNLSDQSLTPYMSVNYYKTLARRHGGYGKLQKNVRLFALPGTSHCSGSGGDPVGPGNFDALSAMEAWVERGTPPDNLNATLYQHSTTYNVDFSKPLGRTMPLCKFPEMAKYKGTGDVKSGANWYCPSGDKSMLTVGESGRRAGVSD